MRTHKYRRDTNHPEYVIAYCGREVRRNTTTLALTGVSCTNCREAFAAELRRLPNVDDSTKATGSR